jgi:signal transduction histidine kinase/ligand-binding sensor protein
MAIDIDRYLRARDPPRPLDLFPEGALLPILDGFGLHVRAGIALLYPKNNSEEISRSIANRIDLFSRLENVQPGLIQKTFHPFCQKFRDVPDHEKACWEFDAYKAAEYWQDPNKKPEVYDCHMGLTDMAYPLRVRGQVVAVVLAGQIITEDAVPQVKKKAEKLDSAESRDSLIQLLESSEDCPRSTLDEVAETFGQFRNVGRMLQDLLDRLYNQQWDAAWRAFLGDVNRQLTPLPVGTTREEQKDTQKAPQKQWAKALDSVLGHFLQLTRLNSVKIYSRRHSCYELWGAAPTVGRPIAEGQIPVKLLAPLPGERLTPIQSLRDTLESPEDFDWLEQALGFAGESVTLFVHQHQASPSLHLDTLVALSGAPMSEDEGLVKEFCEIIAMRTEIARLVFVLQEERQKFADRVGHVGHTAKTPLQKAVIALTNLKETMPITVSGSPETERIVDDCVRDIRIAKLHLRNIYTPPSPRGRRRNLREFLEEVRDSIRELAEERQCEIDLAFADGSFNPNVRDQGNLSVAFTNLLDNATKYADPGEHVTIRVRPYGEGFALVVIENRGQGIPPSHVEAVRASFARWEPSRLHKDLRRRREGTGLGLTMAIEYLENHGGWLEIRSDPLEPCYQDDPSDHWTTTVTVGLPITT